MKQTRIENAVEQTVDYVGNFVYEDNQLSYILNYEGRTLAKHRVPLNTPKMEQICNPPLHLKKNYTLPVLPIRESISMPTLQPS
jgi:hypothetical protein